MITSDEIRRSAARNGVDPMVIDHDYAIGCFLAFLGSEAMVKNNWVFKGGTALAKCYFGNYRFSEDLDFTLTSPMNQDQIIQTVLRAARKMEEVIGIRTTVRDVTSEIIRDAYGKESYEVRSYYEGVWYARGAPRSIRIHLNRDEVLAFPPSLKRLLHLYSDSELLAETDIVAYTLEEILVEKLRAFSGQRRFAIARDIFDLHYLSSRSIDIRSALRAFRRKCEVKGVAVDRNNIKDVIARKEEFRSNWDANLEYLVPSALKTHFDDAWIVALDLLQRALAER